jgi:predicted DNA-binding protein with PD1-like motif
VIVAESTRTRRLVGRLDRGADLLSQLNAVCRSHGVRTGEIRAVGALEEVVLGEWDQRSRALRPPRRFDAAFEILTLTGTIGEREGAPSVHAWVSLSRERDNGIELIGGRLVAGRVFACEFVIDAFDDLPLARAIEPASGLHLWEPHARAAMAPAVEARTPVVQTPAVQAPVVAAPVVQAPAIAAPEAPAAEVKAQEVRFDAPARTSWSDVVAASERRAEAQMPVAVAVPDETDEEPMLPPPTDDAINVRPGDFIDHPKFGRVAVERVDGDMEFVTARLRNQRLIRLSLDVLTLIPAGQAEPGKNLFRAVAGK